MPERGMPPKPRATKESSREEEYRQKMPQPEAPKKRDLKRERGQAEDAPKPRPQKTAQRMEDREDTQKMPQQWTGRIRTRERDRGRTE